MLEKKNEQKELDLDKLLSMLLQSSEAKKVEVKVGDKVVILNKNYVTYLVPKGSKETVGSGYKNSNNGLSVYFTQVPGKVIKTDKTFVYNCGHCSREHKHDILVYYKELNKSFYTSSDSIKLVS